MKRGVLFLKPLILLSLLTGMMFQFIGCLDDPVSNEDSVEITITTFTSLTAGATKQIEGEIKASPAIDESAITIAITKGGTDVISDFTVEKNDIDANDKIDLNSDLGLKVTPKSNISGGDYVFQISATAGTATSNKTVEFSIEVISTPITETDVTLGASANSDGSSLDADIGSVYKTADLRGDATKQATVDVYFAVTGASKAKLGSPTWAEASGWGPETDASWLSSPDTKFIKVTTDYSAITSQEAIDALWSGTGETNLEVAANDVVLVKTTKGTNAAIQVISAATNTSGNAVLKVKIKQ